MPSPLLERDGAVGVDVADHYGNPLAEQRLLEAGQAVVDCSHWGVVTLEGPDRLTWLHSLCSQDLLSLQPGQTTEALILDPQGHIEHRFLLVDDGVRSWLLVEPGRSDALVSWLERMRFRMQVEISDQSSPWAVLAATNSDRVSDGSPAVFLDPWPTIQPGSVGYGPTPHPGEDLHLCFWLHPRQELSSSSYENYAGILALDALLVRAARPLLVSDVDDKALPHEWDWLRTAVHLNKGCYRGQETVAKIHNLGHPPRRAVLLHLDGSLGVLPEAGAAIMHGDREVGRVTRVVRHHEWGPLGLGLVKRSVDVDAELSVSGPEGLIPASQEVIVDPASGATRREAISSRRR